MKTARTILASVVVAAVLVAVVHFTVSFLFAPSGGRAHPGGIATWVIFGVLVTAVGRALPRPAVLLVASLLTLAALVGWARTDPTSPLSSGSWPWASSYFTWIAAGVLFTQGLWGWLPRRDRDGEPSRWQR